MFRDDSHSDRRSRIGERPWQTFTKQVDPTQPDTNFVRTRVELPVHDLRPALANPDLRKEIAVDRTGFAVPEPEISGTKMSYEDWEDDDKIRSVYYDEVSE
jgi:hypothetical protein